MRSKWKWIRNHADGMALAAFCGAVLTIAFWPTIASRARELNEQIKLIVAGGFAAVFVVSMFVVLLNVFWPARMKVDDAPLRCAKCGYDLRASRERCPVCGAAIPMIEYESSARSRVDGED